MPETALRCTWCSRWAASNPYAPWLTWFCRCPKWAWAVDLNMLFLWKPLNFEFSSLSSPEQSCSSPGRNERPVFFHPIPRLFRQCNTWSKLYFLKFLMPYYLFHVNFLDKILDTLYTPALTAWSVSCLSLSCSNKCSSFLLFSFQILPSASPTRRLSVSFFPYAMAGNKNEPHDSKEEFTLQTCFITESVTACIFFWGWSHAVNRYGNKQGAWSKAWKLQAMPKWSKKLGISLTP